MSDRPIVAKSPPATRPRDTNVFSPIGSINDAVAVDPIENVGVPSSFYDFEPDRYVVDDNRMPGEPSSPCGSIFWLYSHLIIPSFWFEDNRAEAAPCLGGRKSNHELDFALFDLPISSREYARSPAARKRGDSMSTSSKATNHAHTVVSLRDHAADDRQADFNEVPSRTFDRFRNISPDQDWRTSRSD